MGKIDLLSEAKTRIFHAFRSGEHLSGCSSDEHKHEPTRKMNDPSSLVYLPDEHPPPFSQKESP